MPFNIADSTVELCTTFRVGSPDHTFLYPKEIREGDTENPVYIWTTDSSEAKVWHSCGDPQLVRVMAKYPAAEMTYMARLRPAEPHLYSRDYREYPNGAGGGYGTYMVQEKRKQHGLI